MRSRRQRQQTHSGQDSPRQLQLQRSAEETPEPSPVPALLEAESVLDQGLFDGQVEQRLEEPRGRDHDQIGIGLRRRRSPKSACAAGASASRHTPARTPPASFNSSARPKRRRSRPQSPRSWKRNPYLTRASSMVRSSSVWKNPVAAITIRSASA